MLTWWHTAIMLVTQIEFHKFAGQIPFHRPQTAIHCAVDWLHASHFMVIIIGPNWMYCTNDRLMFGYVSRIHSVQLNLYLCQLHAMIQLVTPTSSFAFFDLIKHLYEPLSTDEHVDGVRLLSISNYAGLFKQFRNDWQRDTL
jgi:uncharacterized membrane protein YkvI